MTSTKDNVIRLDGRFYKNRPEDAFVKLATAKGWRVSKRGWPDFFCLSKSGEVFAVEVKPRRLERFKRLSSDQIRCFDFLSSLGVRCYVSDGHEMTLYSPSTRSAIIAGREVKSVTVGGTR